MTDTVPNWQAEIKFTNECLEEILNPLRGSYTPEEYTQKMLDHQYSHQDF